MMTKTQMNIIIILLLLIFVALAVVSYQLYNLRIENYNYENNLKSYLQTLK